MSGEMSLTRARGRWRAHPRHPSGWRGEHTMMGMKMEELC